MNDYSPQLIEISDSKSHALATILVLGQAPSGPFESSITPLDATVAKVELK